MHLKANFHCIADEQRIDSVEVSSCIDVYDSLVNTCAFYQRGDRSVQGHIKEVAWHLERQCYEEGMLSDDIDCLGFNLFTGQTPRMIKGNKDYIFPTKEFLSYWLNRFSTENRAPLINNGNVVDISQYIKKL